MKLFRQVLLIAVFAISTQQAHSQSVTDFRVAAAKLFPATVTVESDAVDKFAANERQLDEQMRIRMRAGQGMPVPVYRMDSMYPQLGLSDVGSSIAGFAIAPDLVIVAHIGNAGDSVKVRAAGNRHLSGKIVASDFAIGLSAVRLGEQMLKPLSWNQDELEPGQPLLAARIDESGNAIAGGSMITSNAIASIPELGMTHRISVDPSSIAQGSPLVNEDGDLVGAMMFVGTPFCVPVASIARLIETAESDSPSDLWPGRVGVAFGSDGGTVVHKVLADSPAARIELKSGDRIVSVGGVTTRKTSDVMAAVAMHRGGDTVALVIDRDGNELSLDVVLDSDKSNPQRHQMSGPRPIQAPMWRLEDGKLLPFGGEFKMDDQTAENMRKAIEKAMPQGDRMYITPPHLRGIEVERSVLENTIRELESKLDVMRRQQAELQEKIHSMPRFNTVEPGMKLYEPVRKPSPEKVERLMEQLKQEIESLKQDRQ